MEINILDYASGIKLSVLSNIEKPLVYNQGLTLSVKFDDYELINGDFNVVWVSKCNINEPQTVLVKHIDGTGTKRFSQKNKDIIKDNIYKLNTLQKEVKSLNNDTIILIENLIANLQNYL